jgi:hypothetical protein
MTLNDELIAYRSGWDAVAEFEREELRNTSTVMKFKQLNSIISLAIKWGIFKPDLSDELVYQQWAKIKERLEKQAR